MDKNDQNSKELNGYSTNTKILKEYIHLKYVKYVDLFCILWLILNKRLRIYNLKSKNVIIKYLKSISYHSIDDSSQIRHELHKVINNSEWSELINRFIFRIKDKFMLKSTKYIETKPVSFSDFVVCNLSLGREPFGLCSVLKGCICQYSSNEEKTFENLESRLPEKNNKTNQNSCKCLELKLEKPLVGLVTPFLINNHEKYITFTRKQDCSVYDRTSFEINQKLYSNPRYPLEFIMNDVEDVNNMGFCSRDDSMRLSDLLFDLLYIILDEPKDFNITHEHGALLEMLMEYTQDNVPEQEDNDLSSFMDTSVMLKLEREYKQKLSKVVDLKPFPTIYWLINKELVTKVSKLEGNGLIKEIEKIINTSVNEYDKDLNTRGNFFIESIINDNVLYLLRRFQLTHPILIEIMYNIIFNSNVFIFNDLLDYKKYVNLKLEKCQDAKDNEDEEILTYKVISILNTLRKYGIAGSNDFLHIKCLHSNLAFEMAEGSQIGSMILNLIS